MKALILLLLVGVLVCAGCASTGYGYLYEATPGVDASQADAVAEACLHAAEHQVEVRRCAGWEWTLAIIAGASAGRLQCIDAAIHAGEIRTQLHTAEMEDCMRQAGFVRRSTGTKDVK